MSPDTNIEDQARAAQLELGTQQKAQQETQHHCILIAVNNTLGHQSGDFHYHALDRAFPSQNLSGCPQDFVQQFVSVGNAVHLLSLAEDALDEHLARKEAAQQASTVTTISDIWNGKPSGDTPWVDWVNRKNELESLIPQRRQACEEEIAALKSIAAKYGIVQGEESGAETEPEETDTQSNATIGNEM